MLVASSLYQNTSNRKCSLRTEQGILLWECLQACTNYTTSLQRTDPELQTVNKWSHFVLLQQIFVSGRTGVTTAFPFLLHLRNITQQVKLNRAMFHGQFISSTATQTNLSELKHSRPHTNPMMGPAASTLISNASLLS